MERLNLRVRAEDLARFVAISDEFDWVFGELLQHLVEAFDKVKSAPRKPGRGAARLADDQQ